MVAKTFTSAVMIAHEDRDPGAAFNPTTGTYGSQSVQFHFTGLGRVEVHHGSSEPVVAGEGVPVVGYTVAVGLGEAPDVTEDDVLFATTASGIIQLRVHAVNTATNSFEKRIECSQHQPRQAAS